MASNDSNVLVRLRLLGGSAFRAAARGASGDLNRLGKSSGIVATAIGAVAPAASAAAVAIGVVAAAIARLGSQTNATQDAQMVGFTTLLKSAVKAKAMVAEIRALSIESPILDPQTTGQAAQTLMAFGMSAKSTLPWVKTLGDMSAASGKNFMEIMPLAARALGQIQSKGRLQTQEMNQLAESVGLNQAAIRKQLGMSKDAFQKTFTPGNNIAAPRALAAIKRAMTAQSAGAADLLAKTTAGRISRAKELMAAAAGDFTRPFYDAMGRLATRGGDQLQGLVTNKSVSQLARGIFRGPAARNRVRSDSQSRGMLPKQTISQDSQKRGVEEATKWQKVGEKIRGTINKIATGAKGVGMQILDALKPAAPFLQNILLPLLKGLAKGVIGGIVATFKLALPIVKAVTSVLGWIGTKVGPSAKIWFERIGMVIGFLFGPGVLGKISTVVGKLGWVFKALALPARALAKVFGWVAKGVFIVARGFARAHMAVARFVGTFARTKILRGILNFVGGIIRRVEVIRTRLPEIAKGAVNRMVNLFKKLPQSIGGKLVTGLENVAKKAFDGAKKIGGTIIKGIVHAIREGASAVWDAIKGVIPAPIRGAVSSFIGGASDAASQVRGAVTGGVSSAARGLLGLATGGRVTAGGWARVGERGPELVRLPGGSSVFDAAQSRAAMRGGGTALAPRRMQPIVIHAHAHIGEREAHSAVKRVERRMVEAAA